MWPTLKASRVLESTYIDFIEQLRRCKDRIPPSGNGASIDSIIAGVVRQMVQQAKFVPYSRQNTAYHSVSSAANNANQNRSKTLELLRLCIDNGCKPLCTIVFKRLLDPSLHSQDYIENVLIPFIPELCQYLTTNGIKSSDPPFNSAFKSIVMLWANKVLGTKPSEVADTVLARMRNHTCKCAQCEEAFEFLTESGIGKTHRMYRMGAPKRKHLERELTQYVPRTVATWDIIRSSPQGLTVCSRCHSD